MRALSAQTLMEIRRVARNRRYLLFTILLPLGFFLFFAFLYGDRPVPDGGHSRAFFLVGSTAFGVMAATLISFAGRVAVERQRGWFRLLRTTPLPVSAIFVAKLIASLVGGAGVVVVMLAAGLIVVGPGVLSAPNWVGLALWLVIGALPFTALALAIGYLLDPDSAYTASLGVFFTISFIGGLFYPVQLMPAGLRQIGAAMPAYHYAKVGWDLLAGHASPWPHLAWLGAYLAVFIAIAVVGYLRDEGLNYT